MPSPRAVSDRVAFVGLTSILVLFLAASSALTPLYGLYAQQWGFTPITTTVIFGVYAVVVLVTLLVAGRLSDHVGRRPVLLAALALHVVAMAVFVAAGGVVDLVVGRVLQGAATGLLSGTVGAALIDLDRARGTLAGSVSPMVGTATGGVLSGVFVAFLPAPTTAVFVVLGVAFVLQAALVWRLRETAPPRAGALRMALSSLAPTLRVPAATQAALWSSAPSIAAAWALAGFYGSLGPALVRTALHHDSRLLGGVALFVLAGSGALFSYTSRAWAAKTTSLAGSALLVAGTAITLGAVAHGLVVAFFVGAVVSGAGFGGAFPGGLRAVMPLAAPHERAGVLSVVYVVAYLAMGVPAVAAGAGVVYGGGLLPTTMTFGGVVIAVTLCGLVATLLRSSTSTAPARGEAKKPSERLLSTSRLG